MEETTTKKRGRPRKTTEEKPRKTDTPKKPRKDAYTPPPATEVIKKPKTSTPPPVAVELPDGDNNKYTTFALAIMRLPKIDVTDPVQLRARVIEYFQLCADHDMKPGVAAVGLAIGLDRRRLWEMRNGVSSRNTTIPPECHAIINEVYDSLEVLWESWTTGGKINPVSAIFIGKNNFGYVDKQEHVLTPNQAATTMDPATIEAKYAELPDVDGDNE